jgi:hypothetical protein
MIPRPARALLFLLLAVLQHAALRTAASAVDLRHRSVSSSGQFVVFCDDRDARSRIVSFVEDVKDGLLRAMRERDEWRIPIVIAIEPDADPAAPVQPSSVTSTLVNTVAGPKIDVVVHLGEDPGKIGLQRHIVHVLLLEIAYRDRPPIRAGERFPYPPWWLTEGLLQEIRARAGMRDPDIFRSIVNTEKLPSFEKLLGQPPLQLDTAAGAVDRASAYALTTALLNMPSGPASLGRFLRAWPDGSRDPLALLAQHFPTLGQSPQSLAKWWTLQLAQLGKSETLRGLSAPEADAELTALLSFDLVSGTPPKGSSAPPRSQRYVLGDFEKYAKLPGARPALRLAQVNISTLSAKAPVLFRPVLQEYAEICGILASGKTTGIADRLARADRARAAVLKRSEMITDYVNWYEATQTPGSTGQFDRYLRAVEDHEAKKRRPPVPVDPKIAEYLDTLEQEFAPLRPNMIPGDEPLGSAGR